MTRPAILAGAGLLVALAGQAILDRRAIFGVAPGWVLLLVGGVLAAAGLARSPAFQVSRFAWRQGSTQRLTRRQQLALAVAVLLARGLEFDRLEV